MLNHIQITFDLPLNEKLIRANSLLDNLKPLYKYKGHAKAGQRILIKEGEYHTVLMNGHIYAVVRDKDVESFTEEIARLNLTSTI